uniref:Uncharacterized protein n=1 Tax=Romanomermis culicivorax TaxID=13658 RepID=A0A915K0Y0_ROMCU
MYLDISNQKTLIESGSLHNLKSLLRLKLSKLGLNNSIIDDLKTLATLRSLDLSGNNIRVLPDKAFSTLKALTNLILNFNYITNLDDDTFDGLNQLNKLDLRVNLLSNISKDTFSKMPNLKELLLAGNYISHFGANQPQSLQQLDLSQNELTKIDKQIFGPLRRLEKLNLDKNEHLSSVDSGTFDNLKNLKSLNLSFTNLSSIFDSKPTNVLNNLVNLITLDLSGLGLKNLNGNFFTGMKNLKNLYLRSNDLETVPQTLLKSLSNVQFLDASQNPWQCDSKLKEFASFLKKLSSQDSLSYKIQAALCAFPPALKGLPVASAKIDSR